MLPQLILVSLMFGQTLLSVILHGREVKLNGLNSIISFIFTLFLLLWGGYFA